MDVTIITRGNTKTNSGRRLYLEWVESRYRRRRVHKEVVRVVGVVAMDGVGPRVENKVGNKVGNRVGNKVGNSVIGLGQIQAAVRWWR